MTLNKTAIGYKRKNVELDHIGSTSYVHIVFSGIKRLPDTHNIIIICSDLDTAEKIAVAREGADKDTWEENGIEFWVESLPVDHMYASACMDRAKRIAWKLRSGD